MRCISVTLLFSFLVFFANAQSKNPVYVSAWVNKPAKEQLSKPLIYIDYWATWCGPCISSMPHTQSLEEKFKKNILFLYISEEPTGKIKSFMEKRGKTFYSASDSTGQNVANFKISALPHSVLLDQQGNIIWKGKPTDITEEMMQKFVKGNRRKKGQPNRIIKVNSTAVELEWNKFSTLFGQLKYRAVDNASNEYIEKEGDFFISGNLAYLYAIVYSTPISHISSTGGEDKKYMISSPAKNADRFKNILKNS